MSNTDPHAENKRLYALDAAAVGPEEAAKRWQVWGYMATKWVTCVVAPDWNKPRYFYQRDPNAPPLPSMDWHQDDAVNSPYALIDATNRVCAWVNCSSGQLPDGFRIERRPNPEWFSLTAPDKETDMNDEIANMSHCDNGLKWAEFFIRTVDRIGRDKIDTDLMLGWFANAIESARNADSLDKQPGDESNMSDEIFTGADKFQAIADAIRSHEKPDSFDGKWSGTGWEECQTWGHAGQAIGIRRKLTPHIVTLETGECVELPKPMMEAPLIGDGFFVAFWHSNGEQRWDNSEAHKERLAQGRCYSTREARDQAERALTRILTGGEE